MKQLSKFPELKHFNTPFEGREIVFWEDERSLSWLSRTFANKPFSKMARFFEPQTDKFMCGPASIAIVLNAIKMDLETKLPMDSEHENFPRSHNPGIPDEYQASFPRYTQRNIFERGGPIKTIQGIYGVPNASGISQPGLNLREMHDILLAHNVSSDLIYVTDTSSELHAYNLSHALSSDGQFVIGNFDRAVWGLEVGGHVSPIAAFDVVTKKALIMDVNVHGRWLWIDVDLLVKSMASHDDKSPRGYLIISEPKI